MSYMNQNFRLFHASNLSVPNFRISLLMYPGSVTRAGAPAADVCTPRLAMCREEGEGSGRRGGGIYVADDGRDCGKRWKAV